MPAYWHIQDVWINRSSLFVVIFCDVESQMEFTQEWKSGRKKSKYEENHKNNYKVLTLRPYEIIVLEKGEE